MVDKSLGSSRKLKPSRASVSFPPDLYREIELLAREKKVSVAWVVREAVEKYVVDKWPLLEKGH